VGSRAGRPGGPGLGGEDESTLACSPPDGESRLTPPQHQTTFFGCAGNRPKAKMTGGTRQPGQRRAGSWQTHLGPQAGHLTDRGTAGARTVRGCASVRNEVPFRAKMCLREEQVAMQCVISPPLKAVHKARRRHFANEGSLDTSSSPSKVDLCERSNS
jgi:hypothetical protein